MNLDLKIIVKKALQKYFKLDWPELRELKKTSLMVKLQDIKMVLLSIF